MYEYMNLGKVLEVRHLPIKLIEGKMNMTVWNQKAQYSDLRAHNLSDNGVLDPNRKTYGKFMLQW